MDWRSWDREVSDPGLLQLIAYWEGKRGERFAPPRRSIDACDLLPVLGDIAIMDVLQDPLRFRYRLHGTRLVMRGHVELTGRTTDDLPEPLFRQAVRELFTEVCETRRPWTGCGNRVLAAGVGGFEVGVLPLSEDGETVTMLLACWRCTDGHG